MKAAKVVKKVKAGALSIEVREFSDGRYGFDYQPPGGNRVKVRLRDQDDAEAKAREMIGAGEGGRLDLLSIDPKEYEEFLRWKAGKKKVPTVAAVIESFIESKQGKGRSEWTLRDISGALGPFGESFGGTRIDQLGRAEVEAWLNARQVGAKRWNALLAHIASIVHFARRDGALDAGITPVEQIERRKVKSKIGTYSPEQLERILAVTPPEWLPSVVLGAFAGMRPEEICPDPGTSKVGLRWENILWTKGKIDVPAEVSKIHRRRFVPILEAVTAFLQPISQPSGPVAPPKRLANYTRQWSRASKVDWINDGLRHSFASYRLAILRNAGELVTEMGTSLKVVHSHYLDLKHDDEAARWFAIRPKP